MLLSHLPPVAFGSTGDGQTASDGLRCDLTLEKDQRNLIWKFESPTRAWKPFFLFLSLLASCSWVEHLCFVPIDSRQAQPHFWALPELIDEDGVLVDETVTVLGVAPRMACLVNIVIEHRAVALLSLSPTAGDCSVSVSAIPGFSFTKSRALPEVAAVLVNRVQSHRILVSSGASPERDLPGAEDALRELQAMASASSRQRWPGLLQG